MSIPNALLTNCVTAPSDDRVSFRAFPSALSPASTSSAVPEPPLTTQPSFKLSKLSSPLKSTAAISFQSLAPAVFPPFPGAASVNIPVATVMPATSTAAIVRRNHVLCFNLILFSLPFFSLRCGYSQRAFRMCL